MSQKFILLILFFTSCLQARSQPTTSPVREETTLQQGWLFHRGDVSDGALPQYNDSHWEKVTIPHDWAISGPFDRKNDLQKIAVTQNLEKKASVKTGRTGGLPWVGVGWYRLHFNVPEFQKDNQKVSLVFDGAMSEAHIYINGKEVCFWPYGYNSFHTAIGQYLNANGKDNILAVRLENKPQSSRWYPGAGLYRNVHLIRTRNVHIPVWGTSLTTPYVSGKFASVKLKTELTNLPKEAKVTMKTKIIDQKGQEVTQQTKTLNLRHSEPFEQNMTVPHPRLWSVTTPYLYRAVSSVYLNNELVDRDTTRFGIRSIRFIANKGLFLNGDHLKIKGVCLHHDLGPLGTAVNRSAIRYRLKLLREMGCNAIRTAHNMPSPELVNLCDEMGFLVMVESFDEWDVPKCINGYHRYFNDWVEKDLVNMIRHYRNDPSVFMWSIGNEVPTQCSPNGYQVAAHLQNICHREDPTRPVTCGMDQISCVLDNGFAGLLDVPGFNYRVARYTEAYKRLPQDLVLGTEASSTVSSRGSYKFPVIAKANAIYPDHQSSSYDLEYCSWSNVPDEDLAMSEDHSWVVGQFVWTGFDYLGEPSPYDTNAWPSHSSMFGIIDLADIPKDRYYLYKSVWNPRSETLHILPHWNWKGREGKITPVFVYTNYPTAELFVNGKSYGKRSKNDSTLQNRFRLMWKNVRYEPGELKVVAYNSEGKAVAEKTENTAGKARQILLTPNKKQLQANGKDLIFVNVKLIDKKGNPCPTDNRLLHFSVSGNGHYKAGANGDPTCLDAFQKPQMHLFNGQLTAIVQAGSTAGSLVLMVTGKGVKSQQLTLPVRK